MGRRANLTGARIDVRLRIPVYLREFAAETGINMSALLEASLEKKFRDHNSLNENYTDYYVRYQIS
jgi:post-segregation antitoxin (ccd killing protein)